MEHPWSLSVLSVPSAPAKFVEVSASGAGGVRYFEVASTIQTQTLQASAIYAAPLTPKTTPIDRHIWQSHGVSGKLYQLSVANLRGGPSCFLIPPTMQRQPGKRCNWHLANDARRHRPIWTA